MPVPVRYYTDPACPWSWAAEPSVRKLMVEFGESLEWTFAMGGLAREFAPDRAGAELAHSRIALEWLRVAGETGVPLDPLGWTEGPIRSSYPACMAVKAAAEQAGDGGYRYLRRLREGIMCERRKLDHAEALVEEARGAALDVDRFRVDLGSHAITEAFGADLEAAAALGGPGDGSMDAGSSLAATGARLPTVAFGADPEGNEPLVGLQPYARYRDAASAAGAEPAGGKAPGVEELVARFGRVTTQEIEAICELPGPRAAAELFRLAEEWRLRPVRKLTGYLWDAA